MTEQITAGDFNGLTPDTPPAAPAGELTPAQPTGEQQPPAEQQAPRVIEIRHPNGQVYTSVPEDKLSEVWMQKESEVQLARQMVQQLINRPAAPAGPQVDPWEQHKQQVVTEYVSKWGDTPEVREFAERELRIEERALKFAQQAEQRAEQSVMQRLAQQEYEQYRGKDGFDVDANPLARMIMQQNPNLFPAQHYAMYKQFVDSIRGGGMPTEPTPALPNNIRSMFDTQQAARATALARPAATGPAVAPTQLPEKVENMIRSAIVSANAENDPKRSESIRQTYLDRYRANQEAKRTGGVR